MVISPRSVVRLGVSKMGAYSQKGFGIFARMDIRGGVDIWEALGIMPGDNESRHSSLSAIRVADGQNQEAGSERVLVGPLRMVNHLCRSFNAEYVYIPRTSAFIARTTRDVVAGEEITVNYGEEWFGSSCPCVDCAPTDGMEAVVQSIPEGPQEPTNHGPAAAAMEERRTRLAARNQDRATAFLDNRARNSEKAKREKAEKNKSKQRESRWRKQEAKRRQEMAAPADASGSGTGQGAL
ncbi:hypothetical protein DFP72DRAFT_851680 [Ephemerocybe angulata]|nr:hypothetical protein DFP72DRAFT_851680 [Tulosesus angulatus]